MTRDEAIDAYLAVFAARGFGAATLGAVAEHAETSPAALADALGDRWDALDQFTRRLDRAALTAFDPTGSVRERLFDLAMARFDAARPHRDALAALDAEARRRPALGLALLTTLPRTAALFLSAAGANTIGLTGLVRVNAFAAILGDVARSWFTDAEPDQGQTMRALDRRLEQAERCSQRLCNLPGSIAQPMPGLDMPSQIG